jgi:hypothetical protein
MSTIDILKNEMKKNISEIQALAVTLMNSPVNSEPDPKELYSAASQQPTVVVSDEKLKGKPDTNLLVSFSGEDVSTANWSVKIVPSVQEGCCCEETAEEREYLVSVVREASYELLQREMVTQTAYLTDNPEFNCMIKMTVPVQFAKMAYDFGVHYYPCDEKNEKSYAKSKNIDMPAIRIVCFPDWVNEEWLYWKSGGKDSSETEPPRIMMIYDVETNSAFLLGAKSFSEIKKAVKILAWNSGVNNCDALPVNAAAKTLRVLKSGKTIDTTFLTFGIDCKERNFIGSNPHSNKLKGKSEAAFLSGNSGLLLLSHVQGRKKSTVSFADTFSGSINTLKTRCGSKYDLISCENLAVEKDEKGDKKVILNEVMSPAGSVIAEFNQEEKDLSLPEYFVFLTKDETLPPVSMVKDLSLIASLWFSYSYECDCCGEMKVVPGSNPDAVWDISRELEIFDKAVKKIKPKLLVLNTGCFLGTDSKGIEIGSEIALEAYHKIAKGEVKWKEWKLVPGFYVPDKNTFKTVRKDYDTVFDVNKATQNQLFIDILRDNIECKIEYLRYFDSANEYVAPFYRILSKLI